MLSFAATIKKFGKQGEKTGWTYIDIPAEIARQLKPACKKSFRVKGKLDDYPIMEVALSPVGEGNFIMAIKHAIRKAIGKQHGQTIRVQLAIDDSIFAPPPYLMECLADEPQALKQFNQMPLGHQRYFCNWIADAKTEPTRIKRITQTVMAMIKKQDYAQMIRSFRSNSE